MAELSEGLKFRIKIEKLVKKQLSAQSFLAIKLRPESDFCCFELKKPLSLGRS